MKRFINNVLCLIFICLSLFSYGQKVSILKDSICYNNICYNLEELNLPTKNKKNYKKIQQTYDIFNSVIFESPDKRINAKKDTLKKILSENILKESQYGFEKYKIIYNKNDILNLSVKIQSYGSPWEDIKYYCFDTDVDEEIGNALFINQNKLLQLCNKRFKKYKNKYLTLKDLSNYQINTNNKGKTIGISFIFFDINSRTSSSYPQYIIFFHWNEIEKYISLKYKNRIIKK